MRIAAKLISVLFLLPLLASSQSAYQDVREGNDSYKANQFVEAEQKYRASLRKDGDLIESSFNLGDALYRQGKFEEASKFYQAVGKKAEDKEIKSKAYHNLGNSLLKEKKLEESIEAYKNALINNPKDEESRYNYSYAKRQLQEQQEQEQQEQDENKDENKEEQEDQENQDQDKKDSEEEEKEEEQEQEQDEKSEEEKKEEEQKQQEPKEQQVSRDDAERILEALNQEEKELQEKLKKQKIKKVNIDIEKDW